MHRDKFGWGLPPGTTGNHIDEAFGGERRDLENECGEAEDRAMERKERRRERSWQR